MENFYLVQLFLKKNAFNINIYVSTKPVEIASCFLISLLRNISSMELLIINRGRVKNLDIKFHRHRTTLSRWRSFLQWQSTRSLNCRLSCRFLIVASYKTRYQFSSKYDNFEFSSAAEVILKMAANT